MGKVKQEKIIREFSSGGVVFKENKWLVTKSSISDLYPKAVWRLPKGWIDEGETLEETAIREVKEEGGVEAKILNKIETIKYFYSSPDKGKVLKFVTFFLMEWVKDFPEGFDGETSEIIWLPFEEAYKLLSFSGEKQILKKAQSLI
ncbi:MAG: NUDIX domain-containing protein [Candidatus Woesebacteria bacterium]|nr:NUDIX domain-containing protein [Candidatus Woesebacteria bacterium]